MTLAWNAWALPGLLMFVASCILAWIVYMAAPRRAQNRHLAIFLPLEGVAVGSSFGLMLLLDDPMGSPQLARAIQSLNEVALHVIPWTYLAFLGTIDAPLSRPLRSAPVRMLLMGAALASLLAWPYFSPRWDWTPGTPGSGTNWVLAWHGLTMFYGLAVAVSAVHASARGSAAKARAVTYALAFGARDLPIGGLIAFYVAHDLLGLGPDPDGLLGVVGLALQVSAAELVFVALVTYGILKHQLFDIDLKIKWTIRRGTVGAAFVAVFFLVSEGAQTFLTGAAGPILGLVAAAALAFALAPLQRAADRLADAAMPRVRDTEEYRLVRKREVYRAAVESAQQDGAVTEKERDVLATLADQLGLGAGEARAIEREARGAGSGVS